MPKTCELTFEGDHGGTYYVPCDYVQYINDELVNVSNTTIYLYPSIRQDNNIPYIRLNPYTKARYYPSDSSYNYSYITNATNIKYNSWGNYYRESDLFLCVALFIIATSSLIRMMFGR